MMVKRSRAEFAPDWGRKMEPPKDYQLSTDEELGGNPGCEKQRVSESESERWNLPKIPTTDDAIQGVRDNEL